MTFIKNGNMRVVTFFVISDATTLFSHKAIFPVGNNIKSLESISSKMAGAFEYV